MPDPRLRGRDYLIEKELYDPETKRLNRQVREEQERTGTTDEEVDKQYRDALQAEAGDLGSMTEEEFDAVTARLRAKLREKRATPKKLPLKVGGGDESLFKRVSRRYREFEKKL